MNSNETRIEEIKEDINKALEEIKAIPDGIIIDNFKSKVFKKNTSSLLKEAQESVANLESVYDNLTKIRKLVLRPVTRIITENSRHSNILSYIGIASGILGLILTISQCSSTSVNEKAHILIKKEIEKYTLALDSLKDLEHQEIYIVDSKKNKIPREAISEGLRLRGFKNVFSSDDGFWFNNEKCTINDGSPIIYFRKGTLLSLGLYTCVKRHFKGRVEIKHYKDADEFVKCIFQNKKQLELIILI